MSEVSVKGWRNARAGEKSPALCVWGGHLLVDRMDSMVALQGEREAVRGRRAQQGCA
jgi:hypothetical protein